MQEQKIIQEIKLYAEEMNAAILLHEEIQQKQKKDYITHKEKEYTLKELLRASYKLQKTLQQIELKDKP